VLICKQRAARFGSCIARFRFALHLFRRQVPSKHVARKGQRSAKEEGQAPHFTKGMRVRLRQRRRSCRQEHSNGRTHIGYAACDPAPIYRGGFHQVGHRAHEFAAHRKALKQPNENQQHRRPDPDGRIRRQHAHRNCGCAHQHHAEHQHELATLPVTHAAEHDRTQRPHREPHREAAIHAEQAGDAVMRRKEQRSQDRRQQAIKPEIVPLDNVADGSGEHDASCGSGRQVDWNLRADRNVRIAGLTSYGTGCTHGGRPDFDSFICAERMNLEEAHGN
jgi:hypothetical protein